METIPNRVLTDLMDNLSCSSWNREGRDNAKAKLIDYFIAHGLASSIIRQKTFNPFLRKWMPFILERIPVLCHPDEGGISATCS